MNVHADPVALRETVRARYAERARRVAESARGEWGEAAFARFDASGGLLVSALVRARKPS